MAIKVIKGNLFTSTNQTLVNTINCVGVMGAGIALECRLRYPDMFKKYEKLCKESQLSPGKLWLYKGGSSETDINDKWVLNFPTKIHWRFPSKVEWVIAGLDKFLSVYKEKGITSIAFPVLGGLNGGLDPDKVVSVMEEKLAMCEIPVEIYHYDAEAPDDLFDKFRKMLNESDPETVASESRLRIDLVRRVYSAVENNDIRQLNQLARVDGIGIKTLEKVFDLMRNPKITQLELSL